MSNCAACGRWGGPAGEPCPHCGATSTRKSGSAGGAPADQTVRTPTPGELRRWYDALDRSPVFGGTEEEPSAPVVVPDDFLYEEGAAPVVEPAAPVVTPLVAPTVAPTFAPTVAPMLDPLEDTGPFAAEIVPGDTRDVHIHVAAEYPSYAAGEEPVARLLLTLTPSGPPLLEPTREPVAHVILALDLSASMNHPDKYPLLTEALSGMLYDLRRPGAPEVIVSLVVYAYGAETVFRDQPASALDPREVLRMLDRSKLRFGRYTDMAGALRRAGRIAYDQVRAHRALPVRICVLTDGRPQDVDGTRAAMELIAKLPVDVDALAFGRDADVAVLQEIVSGGRGGTVKQVRAETIGEAFGRIAETSSRVIANRAILDVELRPGVVGGAAYRHRPGRHKYGDAAFGEGRFFRTDLGTLEAGRSYSLFFEVRLPETTGDETETAHVVLRIPGHGGARAFEALVALPRHQGAVRFDADPDVEAAHDVLRALGAADPQEQLRALKVRRRLYETERRDPALIAAVDRAIEELEAGGSLTKLSAEEQAALLSHTRTVAGVA